jgi:hypothetical protein
MIKHYDMYIAFYIDVYGVLYVVMWGGKQIIFIVNCVSCITEDTTWQVWLSTIYV